MRHLILSFIFILSSALSLRAQTMEDGIDYCKGGYYDNALTILEDYVRNPDTDKGVAYYYIGLAELGRNDVEKAKKAFRNSMNITNGSSMEALLSSGAIALLESDYKKAEKQLSSVEKKETSSGMVLRELARIYFLVDPFKYIKEIDKCIAKSQKKGDWWAACLIEGDLAVDTNSAAPKYELAMSYKPEDFEAVAKYARLYEDVNPQYAITAYQRFIQDNSSTSSAAIAEILLQRLQEQ